MQQLVSARCTETQGSTRALTSSPTLTLWPPKPGSKTLSPSLTETGTTLPSLPGAPGPVASTRASGGGVEVVDEGKKMPLAVFFTHKSPREAANMGQQHCAGLRTFSFAERQRRR